MCDICDSEEELTLPKFAESPRLCQKCFYKRNNMLKSTDYKTKVMKPKDDKEIDTDARGLPKVTDFPDMPKCKPPKPEDVKSPTTNDRIAALELAVYSAFAINEDGTARKLKKKIKR